MLVCAILAVLAVGVSPKIVVMPFDARLAALPWVLLLHVRASASRKNGEKSRPSAHAIMLVSAAAFFSFLSVAWSLQRGQSLEAGLGLMIMVVLMRSAARLMTGREICGALRTVVYIVVLSSALVVALGLGSRGNRVQGIFGDANGLGLFAVLALPLLIRRRLVDLVMSAAVVWLLVASGSRASALALICAALFAIFLAKRSALRLILLVALLLISVSFMRTLVHASVADPGSSTSITRTGDSRSVLWRQDIDLFKAHVLTGVGAGAVPFLTGSAYLGTPAALGIFGVALSLMAIFGGVLAIAKSTSLAERSIIVGGLVGSFFEGWLFTGGNGLTIMFWLVAIAIEYDVYVNRKSNSGHYREADAAADSGIRSTFTQIRPRSSGAVP